MSERPMDDLEPNEHDASSGFVSPDNGSPCSTVISPTPANRVKRDPSPTEPPSRKRSHEEMQTVTLNSSPPTMPAKEEDQPLTSIKGSMLPPPVPSSRTASLDRSISPPYFPSSDTMTAGGGMLSPRIPASTAVSNVKGMSPPPSSSAASASTSMPPPPRPTPKASSGAVIMPPLKPATLRTSQSSQLAPQSGQKPEPSSPQRVPQTDQQEPDQASDDETTDDFPEDPIIPIAAFGWQEMQQRYHDTVKELEKDEQRIFAEFESLCNFFNLWSQALPQREVERSFKRLKTQMAFVQHEEDELEERRRHYAAVIDAFNAALRMIP